MQELDLRQRFTRRLAMGVFLVGAAGSALLGVLHRTEDEPYAISLLMPWVMFAATVVALLAVYLLPTRTRFIVLLFIVAMIGLLTLSVAVFLPLANAPGGPALTSILPPTLPGLISINLIAIVFLPPRLALRVGGVSWLLVGLPVLIHLLLNPAELATARGQEMMLQIGPTMLLILGLIPYQQEVARRLSDLRRNELLARTLADRDPLTDLYNRRAFENLLIDRLAEARSGMQLILFDIDYFKRINDSHGHSVGDQVLVAVATRAATVLSRGDHLARWGGEEFAVLARYTPEQPLALAEQMRAAIANQRFENVGTVSASFGVTAVHAADDPQSAFERADQALYRAKENGRNRVELG